MMKALHPFSTDGRMRRGRYDHVNGIDLGTVLTLVVIPVVYSLVDDTRRWIPSLVRRLGNLGPKKKESPLCES